MGTPPFKKIIKKTLQIALPVVLGGFILVWVYRDFDFSRVGHVLLHEMNYWWILVSLIFGVFSHIFRGWRWKQTLEPLDAYPKSSNCVNAIFISYAANLVLPRVGEVSRCTVLSKYDGVSFSKSLGTVVTERIIDSIMVLAIVGTTFILQLGIFKSFFLKTGTSLDSIEAMFLSPEFYIIILCVVGVSVLLYKLMRLLSFFEKVKGIVLNVWEGILTLKHVKNKPLFILYTFLIWFCYFMEFYLTFFCFDFSSNLSFMAGLVLFAAGSVAVVVPTPNGAGPWHFAIISMMVLYGVNPTDAGIFALIKHGIQTLLLILLGVYGLVALPFTNKN
ncbi:lysylphosphatidylglycerol synthase transmembrane domain-containing protein [uncultured Bacteroides sp.]|uniref:lysylphosphatidylglycerol synthase transmembrane domain-containing protein n=1 Tax=uncultured Bacteroides sp. TaxID=162156 RepID=UPI002AAAB4CB|nr:lysylphosphatidylglycerol synthase transmembrane domain-containing protein [uncultured Bacteroides sp.]